MIPDCFSLKYLENWSASLNYSIQAKAADANLPLMRCRGDTLVPLGQSMGWHVWMWQKVPPIDIFWHVTLVKICQAYVTLNEKKRGKKIPPPSPRCPTSTPTFHSLLKEAGWHFKSLLFCLSRHWLLRELCPWGTCWIHLKAVCIDVITKQHI